MIFKYMIQIKDHMVLQDYMDNKQMINMEEIKQSNKEVPGKATISQGNNTQQHKVAHDRVVSFICDTVEDHRKWTDSLNQSQRITMQGQGHNLAVYSSGPSRKTHYKTKEGPLFKQKRMFPVH